MKKVFLVNLVILLTLSAGAQRVGLVLSGGGAKGLAHIGVIRVLEANNIPIDYIAGTSIGAIVGGLYAAGYSPDEMEELFRSDEFYFWSTGKIQQEYRYYFKQREEDPSWIELKVDRREDKLKILPPTNIIPQEQMDFAFMEIMAATNAVCRNNFDSLMIPFRCVATDVYKNAPVVLSSGDLGEAIRASMTVPLYFKPIEINNVLLFDGGIVNNFPHDIMKEVFKPDIIIGHKVADEPKAPSPDDVIEQILNIAMRPTNYEITPEEGILMETKLKDVGLLDFKKIDDIMMRGAQTVYPMIDSIKSRIKRRVSVEEVTRRREAFNAQKPALLFQNIQVEGISDAQQRRFIINSIKHRQNIFTIENFKKEYFKLVSDEQIRSMRPIAHFNYETGYFDVHLKVEPEKKARINVGGNISTKPINQGFASFDYRIFKNRAYTFSSNIYFGRFYSSFKLGGRINYPSKTPFYLAGYFTLNRWDFFSSSNELFFENVRPPYIIQYENNLRTEAGFPLGVHNKITGGVAWSWSRDEYYQIERFNKEDTPDKTNFNAIASHVGFESNSQNQPQYATEGIFNSLTAWHIVGKERNFPGSTSESLSRRTQSHSYLMIKGVYDRYYPLNRKVTLGSRFEAVFSNKKNFSNYTSTVLSAPGFYPTPHSKAVFAENFHANNYLATGLKGITHLNSQLHFRLEGYAFVPVHEVQKTPELLPKKDKHVFDNYYLQGMAAMVYSTGVGPLSVALNYYDKTNNKWFITLNFGYILFNKRGIW